MFRQSNLMRSIKVGSLKELKDPLTGIEGKAMLSKSYNDLSINVSTSNRRIGVLSKTPFDQIMTTQYSSTFARPREGKASASMMNVEELLQMHKAQKKISNLSSGSRDLRMKISR